MHPLHRLYRTKLTLLALVVTVAGVALLVLSRLADGVAGWSWLASVPAVEFGAALFTTGLIVVASWPRPGPGPAHGYGRHSDRALPGQRR